MDEGHAGIRRDPLAVVDAQRILEHAPAYRRWNDSAFSISRHLDHKEVPGVDYLFLYWIARDTGVITAQD